MIKLTRRFSLASTANGVVPFICGAVCMSGCGADRTIGEVALSRQAHGLTKPVTLKVVTYNIQDVYFVSIDRSQNAIEEGGK